MPLKKIYKPKNDDDFLEDLAMIIFVSGFRYDLVEKRWPLIKKAFDKFSIDRVSKYNEKNIEKLLKSKGMIKNKGKINAIIENARKCNEIRERHGSVLKHINEIKKNYGKNPLLNPSLEEFFISFDRIGKVTSGWLASLHNAKGNFIEYEI